MWAIIVRAAHSKSNACFNLNCLSFYFSLYRISSFLLLQARTNRGRKEVQRALHKNHRLLNNCRWKWRKTLMALMFHFHHFDAEHSDKVGWCSRCCRSLPSASCCFWDKIKTMKWICADHLKIKKKKNLFYLVIATQCPAYLLAPSPNCYRLLVIYSFIHHWWNALLEVGTIIES